jgi:hypothetical protein
MTDRQNEIDQNLEFFLRELPQLLTNYRGKFVIIRDRKFEGFFDTVVDAVSAGNKLYPDKIFSVQQVTDVAIDLGFYSYAVSLATAQ